MNKIYNVRGQKVMLDADLAVLYEVETKNDFMFELTTNEYGFSRSQIGTLKQYN